jgi:predicted phosphodiesterase
MSVSKRLSEVFESSIEIPFDDASKIVLFSDLHRGDNTWADDFAHNANLFFHALNQYKENGFTYIEIGDGDELFENKHFAKIRQAHSHIFWVMREFYRENRLKLIFGNHDMERKSKKVVEKTLYRFHNERTGKEEPLFEGIEVHEGLILRHPGFNKRIFLVHGHQGDLINDRLWRLGRFFVRHVWRHLQLFGVRDQTSPAQNFKKRHEAEAKIEAWVEANNQMLIAGHTHRSVFPDEGKPLYFNSGSGVHPRCITGIEIEDGNITLIKWRVIPDANGALHVKKDRLAGPKKLEYFLKSN